ncbi:MAG TPA: polysaccharide deacetylase family protein [Accumulibacter sp.]|jgi:peptidoglycan/xylan/chitin deacetylase (PgdA/CDA1 family)|nr:polysaccharide deacetylase family protein [Accumulibacter sp.]HQC79225.1 polysaccharide deacetylase family protein [Accumulibacter sp.]
MKSGIYKPLFRMLSIKQRGTKLLVFIFHRIVARHDPLLPAEPDAAQFDWMVRFVSRNFNVLSFGRALALLQTNRLPAASACITFDDGYQDNFSVAAPILRRHGVVGTFFIATKFVGGGRMWNDDIIEAVRACPNGIVDWSEFGLGTHDLTALHGRLVAIGEVLDKLKYFPHRQRETIAREIARRAGLPDKSALMMNAAELKALRDAGMELGSHTHSHPILSKLSERDAEREVAQGKAELEAILGEPVTSFAYPNGNTQRDLGPRDAEIVKRLGFLGAATTDWGVASDRTDPFLIPRFTPWDRSPRRFAMRCAMLLAKG